MILQGCLTQLTNWVPNLNIKTKNLRRLTSNSIPFQWTPDLEEEFEAIKKDIKQRVEISPLNTELPLDLYVDAAKKTGLGFILTQPLPDNKGKTIVAMGSTTLSQSQRNYSL